MDTVSAVGMTSVVRDDREYDAFLGRLQARFLANLEGKGGLFTTDADGLFDAYLDQLSADRQYHTCNACRRFVEGFGGLVTIDAAGRTTSAIWDAADAPDYYKPAVAAMARLVRRAKVTGVFLSSAEVWGQPVTGPWRHLAVTPPDAIVFHGLTETAGQAMAAKREDFGTVSRALAEFTRPMIEQALTLLRSDSLYRSEKVIGPAQWLHDLHVAREAPGANRANVTWRAIASAPAGFCHPRSSMVGTLLEDIAAGMDFAEVSRRFAAKMHPLQYQRPQAPPSAGNIAQAEKVMAALGAAGSLARRFARLDEVEAIWRPAPPKGEPAGGGVFSHLIPKEQTPARIVPPPQTMTWEKFAREVLPSAESIEFFARPASENFAALTTAVNPGAPPILQWDREDRRNPVSLYVWHGGSQPEHWGLASGRYHKVNAVAYQPSMWGDPDGFGHQGKTVLFILDGARETRPAGAAIFPETLRSEFHGIRATIEAYSRSAQIEGMEQGSACGLALSKNSAWNATFRVTTGGVAMEYRLDRWD